MTCKCEHVEDEHRLGVCCGSITCLCTKYEEKKIIQTKIVPKIISQDQFQGAIWEKDGWNYKKSFGGTQKQMVDLYLKMGKSDIQIQNLLHCKRSSIRGRKSELRSAGLISNNY